MGWKTGCFGALLLGGLLAACASVPPPPPTPEPVRPPPEPRPPYGAAPNLPVPNPGPDGQFATVNSGIGPQETIWHLRAALNVAALACRSEEHTSELQSLMRISYAVFCLKK